MSILTKFDTVEVKADNRISGIDKQFCEIHQSAYDSARYSFQELKYFWNDISENQKSILESTSDKYAYTTYLRMDHDISENSIQSHIAGLHSRFIHNIVGYFNRCYHVSADTSRIEENLFPQNQQKEQHRYDKEMQKQYDEAIQILALRYESVIDQIFVQLDGRGFVEQAVFELKEKCHNAAWNAYGKTARYELKNETIRFDGYSCSYKEWFSQGNWELSENMKKILYGAAYFETNSFSSYPDGFSNLLGYNRSDSDLIKFPTCDKIRQLKMFKNGRVDLKFTSSFYARQFISGYLGLTAEEVPS